MSNAERDLLKTAYQLSGATPHLVTFEELAARSTVALARLKSAAVSLQNRRYCIVTFGGLQLTAAGMTAAGQA
jgi:hypothetical protein